MGRVGHDRTRKPYPAWAAGGLVAALACLVPAANDKRDAVRDVIPAIDPSKRINATTERPPLVHVDGEWTNYLNQAAALIKEGAYDKAIQVLQALILREDSGFCPEGKDKSCFVSMGRKAGELIGSMGPKGLKLYRTLYDPQAHQLYAEAMESQRPEPLLRRVAQRYLHTSYGPAALETLGALYFDRARFSQAAGCWRQLLPLVEGEAARGALLARIAAAHHLAGEDAPAREIAKELQRKHPNATAVLGGKPQRLADFLARVRALPPAASQDEVDMSKGWPGLGGHPAGLGRMSDCDVVLTPRWQQGGPAGAGDDLSSTLQAGRAMYLLGTQFTAPFVGYRPPSAKQTVRLQHGRLYLTGAVAGREQGEVALPALVHPAVAGELVIARLDDKVIAYDLLTGRRRWETVNLPMARDLSQLPPARTFGYGGYRYLGDGGRYALTVGGGRAFTTFDYLPSGNNLGYVQRQHPGLRDLDDGSRLAAVLLKDEGKLDWQIGRGRPEGGHEVLRNGKFLCPPTYHAERLYVGVLYLEKYHLACLDAATGSPIWVSIVAQTPMLPNPYGAYRLGADPRLALGSPPAVADGRVFVATNAGVVAAFDEETGQAIWAHQYTGAFDTTDPRSRATILSQQRMASYPPANPLVVARGCVVCLPADGDKVLALDCQTGRERWSRSRSDQSDLTGLDAERVLLSGDGLSVLRIADGEELYAGRDGMGVHGRPAVTERRVLASAESAIRVLDLRTYQVSSLALASADGFLGNLVSADGKLVSANMLGLCTYFSYEAAREELTRRMDKVPQAQRAAMLLERGSLAFDAKWFAEALEDLQACEKLSAGQHDTQTAALLRPLMLRTHVALGNQAATGQEMRRRFEQAMACAATTQEKAHMTLRMALCHERDGQYVRAAALAQEIGEKYGEEELVWVEIGPDADDTVRFDSHSKTCSGESIARDYIKGLLEKYGRECYAEFDRQAKEALDKARAGGQPKEMLAVKGRWPNSEWADDALFAAAEACYRLAKSQPARAEDYLVEVRRHLHSVARMQDSPLRISAIAGLAAVFAEGGHEASVRTQWALLRGLDRQTEVSFGDMKGTLADVQKSIEGKLGEGTSRRMAAVCRIAPPLKERFRMDGEGILVLRDQEYRPVRVGERIAVVKDGEVYLLDAAADDERDALSGWRGQAGLDKAETQNYAYQTPGMRLIGALSRDQRILAVADSKTITGLDVVSSKVLWQKRMETFGIRSFWAMGAGSGVLVAADRTGKVACVDLSNGNMLWDNDLVGGSRAPVGPPRIGGGMVVLQSNGGRTVTCFSLNKEGRVAGKWEAGQWAQCEITDDGMLVLLVDGELTVRELAKLDRPLWHKPYDADQQPSILAVSSEMIAFSPSQSEGSIEVLSIPGGGQTLAKLDAAQVNGAPGVPFDAVFHGEELYVLCSLGVSGRRKAAYGRLSSSRGISLQKFKVASGDRLWSRELEDAAMFYPAVLPLTVGRDHVVVTARHHQLGMAYYAHIVESATGKRVQQIDLRQGAAAGQNDVARRQAVGPPVMTDGRLILETSKGVSVYGEQ